MRTHDFWYAIMIRNGQYAYAKDARSRTVYPRFCFWCHIKQGDERSVYCYDA